MLKLELRPASSRRMAYLSPVFALLLTIFFGGLVFLALGKNPLVGLEVFLIEPIRNASAIAELLMKTTPLVLCALGLSVCYRANVWNIGAEGQLIAGGLAAGSTILFFDNGTSTLAPSIVLALATLAGVIGGSVWASITALLKDKFHANEILVSLMLTYIAQL